MVSQLKKPLRFSFAVVLSPLLLGVACDPQEPDAMGTLRASSHPRKVDFEPQPGEYIEEIVGEYALRCMEGPNEARSIGTYVVSIFGDSELSDDSTTDRLIAETVGIRDGTIQDCWMTSIDEDENAEVLIFSKSAGSGGYAVLHVYEFDGENLRPIELPSPDPELMIGYQGRDWYELMNGELYRKFPLYMKGDANCCPQGGSRTIAFDRATGDWELSGNEAKH